MFKKLYNWYFNTDHSPMLLVWTLIGVLIVFGIIGYLCNPEASLNIDWSALDI